MPFHISNEHTNRLGSLKNAVIHYMPEPQHVHIPQIESN